MDDLTSKISEILGDPAAMERIKGLAGMFSQQQPEQKKDDEPPPAPTDDSECDEQAGDGFAFPSGDMIQMIMKIMPLMNAFKRDDNTTRLLAAVRPFLGEDRQKKLDEAMKILQIMRLMPLLKNGLLG